MTYVKAEPGESSDSLIRKFTRKVMNDGILLELKEKEFYKKPSEKKKEKLKELKKRKFRRY
ncbi:30S ribosomal protein S21 [Candidatus Gottesmanbacteria bacterium]|nr:30S ribosomal protein S21 [Candidatus Gottesmanbacteria bacterium]